MPANEAGEARARPIRARASGTRGEQNQSPRARGSHCSLLKKQTRCQRRRRQKSVCVCLGGCRRRRLYALLCVRKIINEALRTQDNPGHRVVGFVHLKAGESASPRGSPLCGSGETKNVQLLLASPFPIAGAWSKILPHGHTPAFSLQQYLHLSYFSVADRVPSDNGSVQAPAAPGATPRGRLPRSAAAR